VLAGRDVTLLHRRELLREVRERLHLLRRDTAERQLHSDHLDVRLALAVDALLEPEADELVLGELAALEPCRAGVEVVELALEDRNHVAGDVLEDLRILERSLSPTVPGLLLALNRGRLHGAGLLLRA